MGKYHLISINITSGTYQNFIDGLVKLTDQRSTYVCIANVHMLVEAYKDSAFSAIVNNADIVTPDGVPLGWGLKLLYGIKQQRVAGMDLLPDLLKQAEQKNIPVFFYGGTDEMLNKVNGSVQIKYPKLFVAGTYSPPFRTLTVAEDEQIADKINASGARLVFVVLGCPKQEKWMASMKGKINAVMIGIGGALPVFVGMQKRAPKWMQKSGMEWFFRLCQEPGRLFKRYFVTNSLFIFLLFKTWLSSRFKTKRTNIL